MYIIQEIQTSGATSALTPAVTYTNQGQAESAFHMKCGAAAISSVNVHTVIMYDEYGNMLRREFYEHSDENEEG